MKDGERAERERRRQIYCPEEVVCLFIGEAPPNGGTFFYAGNSILFDAMRAAFHEAIPSTRQGGFLERFRDLGCYLEDLCLDPVSQWDTQDPRRVTARKAGEDPLVRRIKGFPVRQAFVVMKDIEEYARRVLEAAGFAEVPVEVFPFPKGASGAAEYHRLLRIALTRLRDEGMWKPRHPKRPKPA